MVLDESVSMPSMLSGAFLQIHLVCSLVLEGSLYAQWSFMDQFLCQVCSVVLDGSVTMPMIGFCVIFWTVRFFLVVLAGRLQLLSAVFGHGLDLLKSGGGRPQSFCHGAYRQCRFQKKGV